MLTLIVNSTGILALLFIIWWFWIAKPGKAKRIEHGIINITVDNGVYTPQRIRCQRGKPITLRFTRKDPSPCAETVIFSDWDLSAQLPLGKAHDVTIMPEKAGTVEFTCQMAMYRGQLIVEG